MKKVMKKLAVLLMCLLTALTCFALVACGDGNGDGGSGDGGNGDGGSGLLSFSGITFVDKSVVYDGTEHQIVVSGELPTGASVEYTANKGTNAGEYEATAVISKEGYNSLTLTATLEIEKAEFSSSITFEDEKFIATGQIKTIEVQGELPEGTEVVYANNSASTAGEYNATATLKNPNYVERVLEAKLTIVNLVNAAKNVIDTVLDRPDAWSFMPEAFKPENMAYTADPSLNFSSSFVSVSNIKKRFMGKQMSTLYEGVVGMESLLEKFDLVYAAGEAIAAAYQAFINDNPDNYTSWTGTAAGFSLKIALVGEKTTLLAGNSTFAIELYADSENNINTGRIELTDGAALKYEMSDDYLKFSTKLTIKGVGNLKQIEFVRSDDTVTGYYYNYTGAESVALKTSAVISFDDTYACVMSASRESSDLLVEGYEEVYSSVTGEYLAGEVEETVKVVDYDTYWINLADVSGITSVKAVANGGIDPSNNPHDVYINGSSEIFTPEYNTVAFIKTSRHFDIEMKTVTYMVAVVSGGKTSYEAIETQIPMLFVQEDNLEDFGDEALDNNDSAFASAPALPTSKISVATNNYASLRELLDTIKEEVTYQELLASLGTKNSFFN